MTSRCSPGKGKTFLTIGQDLFSVQEYVTSQYNYSLHQSISNHEHPKAMSSFAPAAAMVYTDLETLRGLFRPSDYGSGVEYADGIFNSIFPESDIGLQIGLWLNGSVGCNQILNGAMDYQLFKLAKYLEITKASGVFLRIGYEFDNPFFGYSDDPNSYILAFRKIVGYLKKNLTKKALGKTYFVWHSWAAPRANNLSLYDFYPGSDFVDWVGLSIFRQVFPWKSGWSNGFVDWGGSMEDVREVLDFAQIENKPTMIAESTPMGGINLNSTETIIHNALDPWIRWFDKVLNLIETYDIDMWSYINCDWDSQPMWHEKGFGDTRLSINPQVMTKWHEEVINGNHSQRFLMAGSIDSCTDLYSTPLKPNSFAKLFSFGVPSLCLVTALFFIYKMYESSKRRCPAEDARERIPLNGNGNEET